MRTGSHVRACWRRLLARHAAAYGFEFEAGILSGFYGSADGFAYETWDFDAALLDVEDYGSGLGQVRLG